MNDSHEWGKAQQDGDPAGFESQDRDDPATITTATDLVGSRLLEYLFRLEDHRDELTLLARDIEHHREVSPRSWPEDCLTAAACTIARIHYPPVDRECSQFQAALGQARSASPAIADKAIAHVKRELSAIIAGVKGLEAMDAIGDAAPAGWDNLSQGQMAREVNGRSLSTFRGRVPGLEGI